MKLILLLLLLTLLPFDSAYAAGSDLYTGEVTVTDQSSAERKRALPMALQNVLQKISGLRNFDEFPVVEPALGRASSIVLSFHYRNENRLLPDGSELQETRLVATFSNREVDKMARLLQLPLWRPERLPLLVWLVVDDGVARRVLPLEFAYVRESMERLAQRRGLQLVWPEADEEGNYSVDLQLLWGGYTEELSNLENMGVIVLAARREGLEWSVRSNLSYGEEHWAWRQQALDLQSVLDESLEQAIDNIATANTIAAEDLGVWEHEITVTGLRNANDYQRCLNYLQGLSTVNQVSVVTARVPEVTFNLQLNALPRYLEEALSRGSIIQQMETGGVYSLVRGTNNEN